MEFSLTDSVKLILLGGCVHSDSFKKKKFPFEGNNFKAKKLFSEYQCNKCIYDSHEHNLLDII